MSVQVVDLPRVHYRPVAIACPGCQSDRPSLLWLALALAIAIAGLAAGQMLVIAAGLPLVSGLTVALMASSAGLGLALGMFYAEVWRWPEN